MTFQDFVSWFTSAEITATANLFTIVAFLLPAGSLLFVLLGRKKQESLPQVPAPMLGQASAAPKTWWEYLTNDLDLSANSQKLCVDLYDIGWEQLNKPSNNREEAIAEAEAQLQTIRGSLSKEEVASAVELAIALATSSDDDSKDTESRLAQLPPKVQSYARLRATILRTEQDRATDLALGVPLTDFREVKKALKEGIPPAHILDQLPVAWRMIRTINDPKPRRKTFRQASRPTRIRLTVNTENGMKEDNRAELDEDWVISRKLGVFVPFTGIVPVYQWAGERKPPILKDRRMVYLGSDPPGAESRLWTRGGYFDRMLARIAKGEHPDQLRREARRRKVRLAVLFASTAFFLASLAYRLTVELG